MAELLLELFSEEIPARMQDRAREDLARLLGELLAEAGLAFDRPIRSYATPRRLTVVATGLPRRQPDRVVERKGPRADAPEQARAGFLRGLAGVEHTLEEREDKKAKVLFAVIRERGREVGELLAEVVPQAVQRLPWPKSMRWGKGDFRWVRPLHSILCLCHGRVVPFEVGGVRSGDATRGHRFLAPEPFAVRDFADYVVRLREAKVILDGAERREIVAREAERLAAAEGLVVADDPALLDELKGLVEWPVPLLGAIDEPFMELPPEVLVSTMRNNQKYLALRTKDGALAPRFVLVANTVATDGGAAIVAGNERVLRARLWDAKFFWDQDRKVPLESRLPALDKVVFHAKLGTLGHRAGRLMALAGVAAGLVPNADRALARRAGRLAKADLVTGMVSEFPELQGIMGGYYARAHGEPEAIAAAIRDQYAPKGPDDRCPDMPESIVVALAEKLDTLTGFFKADIRPTGSKDPFALRRAALGVIRLVLENRLRLPLHRAFTSALELYGGWVEDPVRLAVPAELLAFLTERLKVHLRERGVRHDLIAAAFAVGGEDDLVRLLARVDALQAFVDSEDGRNLLAAYRRASNIVSIEERKDGRSYVGDPVVGALVEPAEKALHAALETARAEIDQALAAEEYGSAMAALARLRRPVDSFFDAVMVNAPEPDLRINRLLLLSQIRSALGRVADFSLVEDNEHAAA
ncbi:MAG TPA: glycine--tRNA ligase subunit beta [Geminicoccaceae bacterium]|nr:glycine--tRNA ligase subunit beta [Geminicoccaceae bacterium]